MSVKISSITKGSYADKNGIKPEELLISINGNEIIDVLDYRFYQVNKKINLVISSLSGETREVSFNKDEYSEIGLEFNTYLMDKEHSCRNKCVFCFIDQLPKGMRKSLYFKDDDSRLSFLFGNYITLTNLTEHEISRIIKMHISPINVSVHTTNPELRVKMMNNRFAGECLKILKRFAEADLVINCQIVACPGLNDGDELLRTMQDLEKLNVNMTAVVPVGLTAYRQGLYPLTPYTQQTALDTINLIENFGSKCKEKYGRRIFYPADEFYIKANKKIPDADFYEGFPAIEDGIGMIASLKDDVEYFLEDKEFDETLNYTVSVACGTSVRPYLESILNLTNKVYPNIKIFVYGIKNDFFGGGVNVSGLVVGRDLISQLKDKPLGSKLLIPSAMLRFEGDLFLDDTPFEQVSKDLNIKTVAVNNNGEELLTEIINL